MSRLWHLLWRDWSDPAWQAQTPVVKFTGFDQDKASAARLRALERAKAARKLADRYAQQADVRAFRRGGDAA